MESKTKGPTISDVGERMKEDLTMLYAAAERRRTAVTEQVDSFVEKRPFAALGLAFGVGYVLAGATFSRTTGRVLGLAVRFTLGKLIRDTLTGSGLSLLANQLIPDRDA